MLMIISIIVGVNVIVNIIFITGGGGVIIYVTFP